MIACAELVARLREQTVSISEAMRQRAQAADAIESLYAEVKVLARKTDEIIGESMSDGQALMAEISDLKGENERLKFLVESTRQSVRATAESNARLRADLDIARLERQIADSANERLREDNGLLSHQINKLGEQLLMLREERAAIVRALNEQTSRHIETKNQLAAAQRDAKRWHMANRLRLATAQHIDAAIREEAQR